MKFMKTFISVVLLSPFLSVAQNNSSTGDCSPIIINNTGKIIFTCSTDTNLEARISDKYNKLMQAIKIQSEETSKLRRKIQGSHKNQEDVDAIKRSISRIKDDYLKTQELVYSTRNEIAEEVRSLIVNQVTLTQFFNTLDYSITSEVDRIDQSLWELDTRVDFIENEIRDIRDNVKKLMPLIINGSINDVVGFWSISTGIHFSGEVDTNPDVALGYEWINPRVAFLGNRRFSFFTELQNSKYATKDSTKTLPGVDILTKKTTTNLLTANTGFRIFDQNATTNNGTFYTGGKFSVGLNKRQFGGTLIFGYEYFKRSARIGVEGFISATTGMKQNITNFDYLGESTHQTKEIRKNFIGFNIRVAFQ